jgi:hypothetical protein
MPHYSEIHRNISEIIENQDILKYPENHFGPNYKILLNSWIYFEELSDKLHGRFFEVYYRCYPPNGDSRYVISYAEQYCDPLIVEQLDSLDCELIAADLILKSGRQLLFPRLFEQL